MGAVYSIGARLIDSEGKAELRRIQILDDEITIAASVECKEDVVCRGNVSVTGNLSTSRITVSDTIGLNTLVEADIPSTITVDRVNCTRCEIIDSGNNMVVGVTTGGQLNITKPVSITSEVLALDVKNLKFPSSGQTSVSSTGTLLPTFLYNHTLVGSIWLIYGRINTTAPAGNMTHTLRTGALLSYYDNHWAVSGVGAKNDEGDISATYILSQATECALYLNAGSIMASSFGSLNKNHQFRSLMAVSCGYDGSNRQWIPWFSLFVRTA